MGDAFYVQDGDSEAIGPVTTELLVEGVRQGRVPVSARICAVGSSEWMPLAAHPQFAAVVREVAPPPPPPTEAQLAPTMSTSDGPWQVSCLDGCTAGPLSTKEVITEIVRGRVGVSSTFRAVGSSNWEPVTGNPSFRAALDHLSVRQASPQQAQQSVAAWSHRPAPYRPHDSEDERRRAARSFTTPAVVTLLLYWLFWLPGLIANIAYLSEASAEQKATGRAPEGKGCLVSLLFLFVGLPVLVVLLQVLLVASAATSARPGAKAVATDECEAATGHWQDLCGSGDVRLNNLKGPSGSGYCAAARTRGPSGYPVACTELFSCVQSKSTCDAIATCPMSACILEGP